jgi:hypothetical protein
MPAAVIEKSAAIMMRSGAANSRIIATSASRTTASVNQPSQATGAA